MSLACVVGPARAEGSQASDCGFQAATKTLVVNPAAEHNLHHDLWIHPTGEILLHTSQCGATVTQADTVAVFQKNPGAGERTDLGISLVNWWAPGFTNEPGDSDEIEFLVGLRPGGGRLRVYGGVAPGLNIRMGGNKLNLNGSEKDGVDADMQIFGVGRISIEGSEKRDVVDLGGGAGTPKVTPTASVFAHGRGGGEVLRGGPRKERFSGDSGRDLLVGRGGRDLLLGGAGADLLKGGPGRDVCRGGPGRDRFRSCEVRS